MSDPERQLLDAVNSNKFEAVRAILKNHPHVDVNKLKCMHWAATFGKLEMVKLLMSAGAQLNEYGMAGRETPLFIAVAHHHMEIVRLLLDAGADPNLGSQSNGITPIMRTSAVDAIELLIKHDANVNVTDHKGASPLLKAVSTKRADLVKVFLQAGANINHADKDGYTPLIMAVENGYDNIVNVLLQCGADRDICAASGRSVHEIASKPSTKKLLDARYRNRQHETAVKTAAIASTSVTGTEISDGDVSASSANAKEASAPPLTAATSGTSRNTKAHRKKSWLHNLFHTTQTKASAPPISVEETAELEHHTKSSSTAPTVDTQAAGVSTSVSDKECSTALAAVSSVNSSENDTGASKVATADAPYRSLHRVQRSPPVPATAETVPFATAIAGLKTAAMVQAVSVSGATGVGDGEDSRVQMLELRLARMESMLQEQTGHIERLEGVVTVQGQEINGLKARIQAQS